MKKIMFNDRYGLMGAVLRGDKTMTRRTVPIDLYNQTDWKAVSEGDFEVVADGEGYYHDIRNCGKYRVGEEVAIAQSYETLANSRYCSELGNMPHRIRITNIKVERLQDISEEDCLREGIMKIDCVAPYGFPVGNGKWKSYRTPQDAFACLIDKVSGTGTWQRNPLVFAYEFELIK